MNIYCNEAMQVDPMIGAFNDVLPKVFRIQT